MEFSVRYVRVEGDSPEKPVLCFRGKTKALVVVNDQDRIYTTPLDVHYHDKAPYVEFKKEPYPVDRCVKTMLEAATRKPITPKAEHVLQLALMGKPDAVDEDLLLAMAENPEPADRPPLDLDKVFGTPEEGEALYAEHQRRKAAKAALRGKSVGKPASGTSGSPKAPRKTPPAAVPGAPKRGRGRPAGSAGGGLIARLAKDLKCEQPHLRKACRAAGMKAPYEDEPRIRKAWEKYVKDQAKKEKKGGKAKGR